MDITVLDGWISAVFSKYTKSHRLVLSPTYLNIKYFNQPEYGK